MAEPELRASATSATSPEPARDDRTGPRARSRSRSKSERPGSGPEASDAPDVGRARHEEVSKSAKKSASKSKSKSSKSRKKSAKKPRRRTFRFTREGKMFLAVTFGVGLAAVNTGNNLLYLVLGLMLSLLLVSGTLSDVALWRARVERVLPKRAQVGRPSVISLRLHNDKPVPAYAVEIEDLALDEDHAERRCFFLKVAARGEQTATYRRVPTRRGWLRFERMMLRTRYPFGLIEKGWPQRVPGELLVYPAVVPIDVRRILGGAEGLGTRDRRLGRGAEIDGLREHREGDEARSIHWRRTAALDRLVVREHAAEARARLTLLLDEARPSFEHGDRDEAGAWDEGFEVAVSEAASLACAALEAGAAVEVRTRRGASPLVLPGSPADPILRFLALVETTPSHEAPPLTAPRGSVVHRIAVSFGSAPSTPRSTSTTTSTPTPTSTSTSASTSASAPTSARSSSSSLSSSEAE
jgi:uncharacterized protein (DUF58 family)